MRLVKSTDAEIYICPEVIMYICPLEMSNKQTV